LTYGGNQNLEYVLENYDNLKLDPNSRGFGADFGAVYEWRPKIKDLSKYKLRLGISLTDVGSLNFDDSLERKYSLNKTITETTYQDYSSFDDFIKKNYTSFTETKNDSRVSLPTATHLNADWNINNVFFLNINGDFGLGDKNKKDTNFIANTISLTPRYESKWVGVYLPINYMDYRGVLAGFGFRLGPLFVGSGSIITNLISDQSKGIDLHAGLQVPIYNGGLSRSDRDDDGIPDRKDECPDVAGLKENNGCPKKAIPTPKPLDTDNDGVIDKFDKCPNVAGPKDNNGCPFEDTDKDDVLDKDDKCPTVAGPKENNGCPWPDTDKDGVLDKDDKCPEIPGVIANNGCPEVKEIQPEVIKKINEYSKTILFDTGKSTIKKESSGSLDAIVAIMNEYKTVNFKIEGHTDSSGKPLSNLKLSKTRAAAVKKYLTDKGISETRLSSEGYGSKKPIASNKTLKGRNLNRRVEINLVK
jgi:outer membrane protein OmpA-like peptidoglycan-associated protein